MAKYDDADFDDDFIDDDDEDEEECDECGESVDDCECSDSGSREPRGDDLLRD